MTNLILLVGTEESCVVSLLYNYEWDSRLIVHLQFHARLADRTQLVRQHLAELSLAYAVAVENDARRFKPGRDVELYQKLLHHRRQLVNHLLPVLLDSHGGRVPAWMTVHTANHL